MNDFKEYRQRMADENSMRRAASAEWGKLMAQQMFPDDEDKRVLAEQSISTVLGPPSAPPEFIAPPSPPDGSYRGRTPKNDGYVLRDFSFPLANATAVVLWDDGTVSFYRFGDEIEKLTGNEAAAARHYVEQVWEWKTKIKGQ